MRKLCPLKRGQINQPSHVFSNRVINIYDFPPDLAHGISYVKRNIIVSRNYIDISA